MQNKFSFQRYLYHLMVPNRCPFCDRVIRYKENYCPECGLKLEAFDERGLRCSVDSEDLDEVLARFPYDSIAREAVQELKIAEYQQAAFPMGRMMASMMRLRPEWKADVLIPVPMEIGRHYRLGFNPAEELAKAIHGETGIPVEGSVLKKKRKTPPQHRLTLEERQTNLMDAFGILHPDRIRNKRVVLVDDVCSSGCTLKECASVLKKAGAVSVSALCFAKAVELEDYEIKNTVSAPAETAEKIEE